MWLIRMAAVSQGRAALLIWLSILLLPLHTLYNLQPPCSTNPHPHPPLRLWFSPETCLDKTAWAIKETQSLGRGVWHTEQFTKCKIRRQKPEFCSEAVNTLTHTCMWVTNTDNPFSFSRLILLLPVSSSSSLLKNFYLWNLSRPRHHYAIHIIVRSVWTNVNFLSLKHAHSHMLIYVNCHQKMVYSTCSPCVPTVCYYCTYCSSPLTQCCVTNR